VRRRSASRPEPVELVQRAGDGYGNNVLGVALKVHSDATISYFTRDEDGTLVSERAPNGRPATTAPTRSGRRSR
jgi:hypothetical protein